MLYYKHYVVDARLRYLLGKTDMGVYYIVCLFVAWKMVYSKIDALEVDFAMKNRR